ncbi:hypothetical protein ADA01nite_16480 [Aneurinibacillus danicus]|uniref:Uncharacterized protein n=1 Tax=Aneurinibacillus danicus TaxID=267746 RepID=A0A511V8G1_9BACL|nr:hypothetical protein ADA01nite_16480 [Aneurinibacillus danicus]
MQEMYVKVSECSRVIRGYVVAKKEQQYLLLIPCGLLEVKGSLCHIYEQDQTHLCPACPESHRQRD